MGSPTAASSAGAAGGATNGADDTGVGGSAAETRGETRGEARGETRVLDPLVQFEALMMPMLQCATEDTDGRVLQTALTSPDSLMVLSCQVAVMFMPPPPCDGSCEAMAFFWSMLAEHFPGPCAFFFYTHVLFFFSCSD